MTPRAPSSTTGTVCHLDAQMVGTALGDWNLSALDLMFFENVGNLVCPASFDLGEHVRVVLMSVTEGEDKPLEYPTIFNTADVVVVTKIDLAEAAGFNRDEALANIQRARPGVPVIETSSRTAGGCANWFAWLETAAYAFAITPR